MAIARTTLASLALAGIIAAGTWLHAQPTGADATPDITLPMEKQAKLTPRQMTQQSDKLISEMKAMLKRSLELREAARKSNDVIKLNCVNNKLLQVKKLLNIAESNRNDLTEAIASGNEDERYHRFGQVTISHEKVSGLRDDAEACIGEELIFIGPTKVDVEKPEHQDDPTQENPFDLGGVTIERPGFASISGLN